MRIFKSKTKNTKARAGYERPNAEGARIASFARRRKQLITVAALVMVAALLTAGLLGISVGPTPVSAAEIPAFNSILNTNIGRHAQWQLDTCKTIEGGGVGDNFTNKHNVWRPNVTDDNEVVMEKSPAYVFTGTEAGAGALASAYNLKAGNDVVFNITDPDTAAKVWADAVAFAQSLGPATNIADWSLAGGVDAERKNHDTCAGGSGETHSGFRVGSNTGTRNMYQGNFFIQNSEAANGYNGLGQYIVVRLQTDWTARDVTTTAPKTGGRDQNNNDYMFASDDSNGSLTTTSFNYVQKDKNERNVLGKGATYLPESTSGYTRIDNNDGSYIISVDIASNSCDYDGQADPVYNDNCAFSFGRINVPTGVYIVLDLNGHTIDRHLNASNANYYGSVFHISSESRLEIMDSTAYENASSLRLEEGSVTTAGVAGTHTTNHKGTIKGGYTNSDNTMSLPGEFVADMQMRGGGFNLSMWADLVVHSGTICNNQSKGETGGAFYQRSKASITIYDGYILHNEAGKGGGVSGIGSQSGCSFTMYGGVLAYNKAGGTGGAVSFGESSYGNFHGGEIVNNTAQDGGAIYLSGNTMGILDSVTIQNNTATTNGGGVFVNHEVAAVDAILRKTLGPAFKFRGSLQINGNKVDSTDNNVYLDYGATKTSDIAGVTLPYAHAADYPKISIGGSLFANGIVANVGVTVGQSGTNLVFTSGYGQKNARNPYVYFFADNTSYYVEQSSTGTTAEGQLVQGSKNKTDLIWVIEGTGTTASNKKTDIKITTTKSSATAYYENKEKGISYTNSSLTCEYGMFLITSIKAYVDEESGTPVAQWVFSSDGITNSFTETNFRFKLAEKDFVGGLGVDEGAHDKTDGDTFKAIQATDSSISYAGEYSFLFVGSIRYSNPSFKIRINQSGVEAGSVLYYKGQEVDALGWSTAQNGVGVDWNGDGTIDADENTGIDWNGNGKIDANPNAPDVPETKQPYFVYSGQYYYPILSADFNRSDGILRVYDSITDTYSSVAKVDFTGYVLTFTYANNYFGEHTDIDFNDHGGAGVSYQTLHRAPGQIQGVGTYVGGVMHAGMYSVTFISSKTVDAGAQADDYKATGVYFAANNFAFSSKANIYVKPATAEVQLTNEAQANLGYRSSAFGDSEILLFDNTSNTSVNPLIDAAANMEYYLFDDLTFAPGVYDRRTKNYYTFDQITNWVSPAGKSLEAPKITFEDGTEFTAYADHKDFGQGINKFDELYHKAYAFDTDAYLVYIVDTTGAHTNLDVDHRVVGGPLDARRYVVLITLDLDADYTDYDYIFDQDANHLVGIDNRVGGNAEGKQTYFWAFEFTVDPAVVNPYDFDAETPAEGANTSVTVSREVTYNGLGQFQLPQLLFNSGVARQLVGSAAKDSVSGNNVNFEPAENNIYANSKLEYNENYDFVVRYKIAEYGFNKDAGDVEKKALDYKNVTVDAEGNPTKLVARIYIPAWKDKGTLTGATGNYTFGSGVTASDDFGTYYEITWEIKPVTVTLSLTVSYAYDGTSREDDYVPGEGNWKELPDADIYSGRVGNGVGGIWTDNRPGYEQHSEGFVFPFNMAKDGRPVPMGTVGPLVGEGVKKYTISNVVYTFSDETFISNNVTFGGGVYTFDTHNANVGNYELSTLTEYYGDGESAGDTKKELTTHINTEKLKIDEGVVWIVAFDDNNAQTAEKRPIFSSQGFNGSANVNGQYGNFVVNTSSMLSVSITPKDISEENVFATDIRQTVAGKTLTGEGVPTVDEQGYIPVVYSSGSTQNITTDIQKLATFPYAGNGYVYKPDVKVSYFKYGTNGATKVSDRAANLIQQLGATDYDLSWMDNTNVSVKTSDDDESGDHWSFAQVLVTGKGNYTGTITVSFRIRPAQIELSHSSALSTKTYGAYDFASDGSDTSYYGYYFDRASHQLQLTFKNKEDYSLFYVNDDAAQSILQTVRNVAVNATSLKVPVITTAEITYGYASKPVFDAIAYAEDGGYFEDGKVKDGQLDNLRSLYTETAPVDADVYYVAIALSNENYEFIKDSDDSDAFPLISGADYGVEQQNLARGTFEIKPAEVTVEPLSQTETYNGLAHSANLTFKNSRDANVLPALDTAEYSLSYKCGDTSVSEVKDAGTYNVSVDFAKHAWLNISTLKKEQQDKIDGLTQKSNFVLVTKGDVTITIDPAKITLNGLGNKVYNAEQQTPEIAFTNSQPNNDAIPTVGEYTVSYEGAGLDSGFPKNAGTYTVKVALAGSAAQNSNGVANFVFVKTSGTTVNEDGSVSGSFTIDPATVSMQVSSSSINFDGKAHVPVLDGSDSDISYSFINAVNNGVVPEAGDVHLTYKYTPRGGSQTDTKADDCIHVGSYDVTVELTNKNFIFGYKWISGISGAEQQENREGNISYTIMPHRLTLDDLNFTRDEVEVPFTEKGEGDNGTLANTPYTGNNTQPDLEVIVNSVAEPNLKLDTDYTYMAKNDGDVGKVTLTVRGIEDYTGTLTVTYQIDPATVSVAVNGATTTTYNGYNQMMEFTFTNLDGNDVVPVWYNSDLTDYTVSYDHQEAGSLHFATVTNRQGGPVHAGTYNVTVTVTDGNFQLTGNAQFTFTINKATLTLAGFSSVVYNAEEQPVSGLIFNSDGFTNRTLLPQADDYTITYDKDGDSSVPVNAGKYQVTVTLKNKDTATGTDVSADNAGRFCANDFQFGDATNNVTKEYEITQAQVAANLGVTIENWSEDGYQEVSTYKGNSTSNRYTGTKHNLLINFVATGGGVTPKGKDETGTWEFGEKNTATVKYPNYTVTFKFTASAGGEFNNTKRVQDVGTYTLTVALSEANEGNFDLINGSEFTYIITPATIKSDAESVSYPYDPDNAQEVSIDPNLFVSELQREYNYEGYSFAPTVQINSVTGTGVSTQGGKYTLTQSGVFTVYFTVTAPNHNALTGSITITISTTIIYIDISNAEAISKVYGISEEELIAEFWKLVATCDITTTEEGHPVLHKEQATTWLQEHVTATISGASRSSSAHLNVGSYRISLTAKGAENAGLGVVFKHNSDRENSLSQIPLITITPKLVTASGAEFTQKEYDGNNTAFIKDSIYGSFREGDIVAGDVVTLTASGVYDYANASDSNHADKVATTIYVTYTMRGADYENYTFKAGGSAVATLDKNTDGKIVPKPVTVRWIDNRFTYKGVTPKFDLTKLAYYSDINGTEVYLVVFVQGQDSFVNAGTYTLEVGKQQYGERGAAEAFDTNYTLSGITHSYTIDKANVTVSGITVNNKVYDGTNACSLDKIVGYEFAGLCDEDAAKVVKALFDGVTAGGHSVTVYIQLPSDNYTMNGGIAEESVEGVEGDNIFSVTVFGTIDKAKLTINGGFTVDDKVYDGNPNAIVRYTADATSVTGATNLSGLVGSDRVNVTVTAIFAGANVLYDEGGTNVVPYTYKGQKSDAADRLELTFVLSGEDSGNYELEAEPYTAGINNVSATITRRTLTPSMTAEDKTYNGKDDATVHITLTGFVSDEENFLEVNDTNIGAKFDSKNVGQNKTVTATFNYDIVTDDPDHEGASKNYYFEDSSSLVASANITPIVLTIGTKAAFTDRQYDGTQNAAPNNLDAIRGAVLVKKIDGDELSLNVTGLYNSKDVVTANNITVTYTLTGADAGNYTLVDNHDTTVVSKWEDPVKTEGHILPREVELQWHDQEFVYSGKDPKFDLTKLASYTTLPIDGSKVVYLKVATFNKDGTETADFVNVGTYTFKLADESGYREYTKSGEVAMDSNYAITEATPHQYTIKQAEVTLTVTVPSKVYDGTDACDEKKVTISDRSGLFDDDLEQVIKAVFKNVVVGTQNVDVYIKLGANYRLGGDANLDTGEYEGQNVYVVTTTAEITKKTLTITGGFTVDDKVYDGNPNAIVRYTADATSVTGATNLSGLVGSDRVNVTVTAIFASANVLYSGTKVVPYTYKGQKSDAADRLELTFVLSGEDSGNYELKADEPYTGKAVSAKITRRTLTPSMTASSKKYDGNDVAEIAITLGGFIQGEDGYLTVDLTGITAHFDSKNVGQSKPVTVYFTYGIVKDAKDHENANKNYYFEDTSLVASANITPIVLTISTKAKFTDREYDATQNATPNNLEAIREATLAGVLSVDKQTVTLNVTGLYNSKNVLEANEITVTYTLTGADAGNYTLVDNHDTTVTTEWKDPVKTEGHILTKKVELHWIDQEFTYSGQKPEFDLTKLAYYTTLDAEGSRTVYLKVVSCDSDGAKEKPFVDAGQYLFKLAVNVDEHYIEYAVGGGEVAMDSNYELINVSNKPYVIKQAEVTLTVAVLSKVYDGTDECDKGNVTVNNRSGFYPDDKLEEIIKAVFKGVVFGTQNVDVYIKLGPNYRLGGGANLDTGEYEGQNVYVLTVVSEITLKEVEVAWSIDGGSLVYNSTDQKGSVHASWTDVNGEPHDIAFTIDTYSGGTPDGTVLHAGSYKLKVNELDPEFAANYKLLNTEFTFTVAKAKVKIEGIVVLDKEFDDNIIATVVTSNIKFVIVDQAEVAVNDLGLYGADQLEVMANGVFDKPDIGTDHVVTVNVSLFGASESDYELAEGQAVQEFTNVEISSRVWIVDPTYGDEGNGWRWTKKGNTYEVELGIMQASNNSIKDTIKMNGGSGTGGIVLTMHTVDDATCTTDGHIYYTALATYGTSEFRYEEKLVNNYSQKDAIIPSFGHRWVTDTSKGVDGWTWLHDGGHTAQVHIKCETCGEEHALNASVTSPEIHPSCKVDVDVTYNAFLRVNVGQGSPFTVKDTIEGLEEYSFASDDVVTIPYTGHNWMIDTTDAADSDADGWTWSEDHSRATLHFKCANCGMQRTNWTTSTSTHTPVDCEADGYDEFSVTVKRDWVITLLNETDRDSYDEITDNQLSVTVRANYVPATGHAWGEPEWTWTLSGDGYSATATFECGNCHQERTVEAVVSSGITPATCTTNGVQNYLATAVPPVSKEGDPLPEAVTNTKSVTIPAKGHNWQPDNSDGRVNGWAWAPDGSEATLYLKCSVCGETFSVSGEVETVETHEVTCTEAGYTIYKVTLIEETVRENELVTEQDVFDGVVWESTVELQHVDALGHSWVVDRDYEGSENGWTWQQRDGKWNATLHLVCENDETHKLDINAKVETSEVNYKDCTSDGTITYTASVDLTDEGVNKYNIEDGDAISVKTETVPPRGHNWALDADYVGSVRGWNWYDDRAVAHFECSNGCGTTVDVTVRNDNTVSYEAKNADGTDATLELDVTGSITVDRKDASCTTGEGNSRKASVTLESRTFSSEKIDEDGTPLGHRWIPDDNYGVDGWVWSDNCDSAVLHVKCENCGATKTVQAQVSLTSTKAPTCTEVGSNTYTATVNVSAFSDSYNSTYVGSTSSQKTLEVAATGHHFVDEGGEWSWEISDRGYKATYTFGCRDCDATLTVTVDTAGVLSQQLTLGEETTDSRYEVSGNVTVAGDNTATCTEPGKLSLRATITVQETTVNTSYSQESAMLGHLYDQKPEHHTLDGKDYHTFTCSRCGFTYDEDCTFNSVVVDPTCESQGYTRYTCEYCEYYYDGAIQNPLGHEYVAEWGEWNEDCTVSATLKCTRCDFSYTPEVQITFVRNNSTCEEAGTVTYTAFFVYEGETYTDPETYTVDVAPTGHSWVLDTDADESGWTWTYDSESDSWSATAHFKCVNCSTKQDVEANVTVTSRAATCTTNRFDVANASASLDGKLYTASHSSEIAGTTTSHQFDRYVHVEEGGVHKHEIRCSVCGELQKTEECTFVEDRKDPTCTDGGYLRQKCSFCGYVDESSARYFDAMGHRWTVDTEAEGDTDGTQDGWLWQKQEDGSYKATVFLKCTADGCEAHTSLEAMVVSNVLKVPTCNELGEIQYTATAKDNGLTFTATKNENIPMDEDAHVWVLDTEFPESTDGWIWNCDELTGKWTATAHFKCANGCEATHTETDNNPGEVRTGEGTCDNPHTIVYTAKVVLNGTTYVSTYADAVESENHSWIVDTSVDEKGWTWYGDDENGYTGAQLHLICTKCGTKRTELAFINEVVIEPTCRDGGFTIYTAAVTVDGQLYTQSRNGVVGEPNENHVWGDWIEITPPSCTETGTAQRTCSVCGEHEEKDIAKTEHTWTEWTRNDDGLTESRHCTQCGTEETRNVSVHTHIWAEEPTWQWSDDHSKATATFTCTICGQQEIVDATVTSETDGNVTTYTATVEFEEETYSIKVSIETPPIEEDIDYGDFGPAMVSIITQIIIMIVAAIVLNRKNKQK